MYNAVPIADRNTNELRYGEDKIYTHDHKA